MHSKLHDIHRFLILFPEELFLIFNQMLSIRAFGRRVMGVHRYLVSKMSYVYFPDMISCYYFHGIDLILIVPAHQVLPIAYA